MKKLVLLVMAVAALTISAPAAQTAPTSDVGCTVEHLSGDPCQGPDAVPAADVCEINTWVDNATCEVTAPDGVANAANISAVAYAELQDNSTWFAEYHYVLRDKGTGQELFSHEDSITVPVNGHPEPPAASFGFGGIPLQQAGGTVVCEITGTHSPFGAAMSAVAASPVAFGAFNNIIRCSVS
jgi:hypothetical protein